MRYRLHLLILLFLILLLPTGGANAQSGLVLEVEVTVACTQATFELSISGGSPPYELTWFFNDGEGMTVSGVTDFPNTIDHVYPAQDSYTWVLVVTDGNGTEETTSGTLVIDGPAVSLSSTPSPPILELDTGEASVELMAQASGGSPPYEFDWTAEGWVLEDETDPTVSRGTASYIATGTYEATVMVTDQCGLTESESLTIVVIDEQEDGEACHPTAQKIADAVSSLFPAQADQTYTCEDIYGIFRGNLTGFQVGFGRMWHAYKLTLDIEELTWEMIRDWHLDGFGWGGLVQLNKIADTLGGIDLVDLVGRVISGELELKDARGAFRAVTRHDAEFEDALLRLQSGVSPGELGQFYRLASDLDLDPATLDGYLDLGMSLSEIRHAAKLSEQVGSDWSEVLELHALGRSWGEIGQAYRLAEDEMSAEQILEIGIKEYREGQREVKQEQREEEQNDRTASKLAEQFQYSEEEIWGLYNGECEADWGCVRSTIREQSRGDKSSDQDQRTAAQLAGKFGVSEAYVMGLYEGSCEQSWSCVRATLRDQFKETGKPDK